MFAPIVITGMHRSGTSMLAGLLAGLGLFPGSRLDPNGEDYFFLRLNEWLMRRAGGAWDWPLPTRHFLDQECFLEDAVGFLRRRIESPRFGAYVGYRQLLLRGRRRCLERPWGWKDPRTIFTFPAWSRIFPEARLLYVHRDGVDVARSLVLRERERRRRRNEFQELLHIRPMPGLPRDLPGPQESMVPYLVSTRCTSLAEAFRLWEEYVEEGSRLCESHPGPKLRLSYEGMRSDPRRHLEEAARFCGLEPSPGELAEAAARVRTGPPRESDLDDEVRAFREQVRSSP